MYMVYFGGVYSNVFMWLSFLSQNTDYFGGLLLPMCLCGCHFCPRIWIISGGLFQCVYVAVISVPEYGLFRGVYSNVFMWLSFLPQGMDCFSGFISIYLCVDAMNHYVILSFLHSLTLNDKEMVWFSGGRSSRCYYFSRLLHSCLFIFYYYLGDEQIPSSSLFNFCGFYPDPLSTIIGRMCVRGERGCLPNKLAVYITHPHSLPSLARILQW